MARTRYSPGWLLVLTLALCGATRHSAAATPISPGIHAILQAAHDRNEFNGVALVAVRGRVIHAAAYGTVGAAPAEMLPVEHRFNIGSIAKEFSAAAVMQLRERHRLSLDDDIARFLTDLPAWGAKVKVRHLLD